MTIQSYLDELDYVNATLHGRGDDDKSFLGTFCLACLRADEDNYETLRPVLIYLQKKYPADARKLAMERIDSGRAIEGDRERAHSRWYGGE